MSLTGKEKENPSPSQLPHSVWLEKRDALAAMWPNYMDAAQMATDALELLVGPCPSLPPPVVEVETLGGPESFIAARREPVGISIQFCNGPYINGFRAMTLDSAERFADGLKGLVEWARANDR